MVETKQTKRNKRKGNKNEREEIKTKNYTSNITPIISQRGITLIALIITIIIMLILVAVSVTAVINGGLFGYAKKGVGDTQTAIDAEQQLANGSIKVAGVWYDSIEDYINGKPSQEQTQGDILITSNVETREGTKYIDLEFKIKGIGTLEEYAYDKYLRNNFLKFIDNNVLQDQTIPEIEQMWIDENAEGGVTLVIDETWKNGVISEVSELFKSLEVEITLPYEQSLRIGTAYTINGEEQLEALYQTAIFDMGYNYVCEILGLEAYYEATAIENQILEFAEYEGTFDNFLLEEFDTSKASLQAEADEVGVTYETILKLLIIEALGAADSPLNIDVTVSNGDTFTVNLINTELYSYAVTEDGTYTFTAEMQDGRKGETTVVVGADITNPYDENGWEVAWTCTDGVWSDMIKSGEAAEGDIVAKFYKTGNNITPVQHPSIGVTLEVGPEYIMVIEGTGKMGDLYNPDEGVFGYLTATPSGIFVGHTPEFLYASYVTEVYVCEGIESLGVYAFRDFTSMTSIKISDTVTSIGKGAFDGCVSLTNISLPTGVTAIGENAFIGCSSLASITIPTGVKAIEKYTFNGCSRLTSVTIPTGVNSIEYGAFRSCDSLASITIPTSVNSIGDYAFDNCYSLTSITMQNGIESIGKMAFISCDSLTSVTIPDSVTSLGESAFKNCEELQTVVLSSGMETLGGSIFEGCKKLENVTIKEGTKSIGYNTFYDCTGLTSITIPSSVTEIGNYAFWNCSNLSSVTILGELSTIGVSIFYGLPDNAIIYVSDISVKNLLINEGVFYDKPDNIVVQ